MTFGRKGVPTRAVRARDLVMGGGAPVSVQGMTKCDSRSAVSVVAEIQALHRAGCQMVRVAVPDAEAAAALEVVVRESPVPVVADIHFDYRLALRALEAGADKLRINPGNIGGRERLKTVAREAMGRGVPLRIGVNSGSLERDVLEAAGGPTAAAMVESARRSVETLEDIGFNDIVLSLKSSTVSATIEAYRAAARRFPYPLHVGVTETGAGRPGVIKSAVGIGALLADGIGDTIRVSLTGSSVQEVIVGIEILVAVGLRKGRPEIISCPTCGRCSADIGYLVEELRKRLEPVSPEVKVAVMGCEVNGPGEAAEADVGVAMGKGRGVLVKAGRVLGSVPADRVVEELCRAVSDHVAARARASDPRD
ncbi:MAG: flavodoxin-dependent (E)-4-hydroxy-3-methylbut-2-enyl-diphosphate synthase [Firmicutes bacterium]|nr:flavodoxin-dependent (E)-4-hydroxy-3-methylbut-2-enyl-diphosphate synthase [Bacillota bacterium]